MTPIAVHTPLDLREYKTVVSWLIEKFIDGDYSHVVYLVREGDEEYIFESSGDQGGVKKHGYSWWCYFNRHKVIKYLDAVPYHLDMNLVVDKPYDYGNVLNRMLEFTFRIKVNRDNPKAFTCSELGAWARNLPNGYRVNPQDIIEGCLA